MMEDNQNARVQTLLKSAIEYLDDADFESAIEELKTAEILDKDNPVVLYNLGVVYSRQGLHQTAASYYEKLLNLSFSFIDSLKVKKMLVYSKILANKHSEALSLIDEVLRLLPNDSVALSLAGFCYEKTGRIRDAIESYEKILAIDAADVNANNSIAYLLASEGKDLDKALGFARKALESNPASAAYNDTIGYIYSKKNQGELAKKHLKKALELDPASSEIRTHIHELLKI
jgi:tetratricopeptide (TPR) repeat protein